MNFINTFYVLDFDRCLGNIDASFYLLEEVIDNQSLSVSKASLDAARKETESSGGSFDVFGYIKDKIPNFNINLIESDYINSAANRTNELLEPGARKFVDFLSSNKCYFCIMSYGDKDWQTLKIQAAGLGNIPIIIVPTKQKNDYINDWYDENISKFVIPSAAFTDKKSLLATEVVLVDDKKISFKDLNPKARGYWVSGSANPLADQSELPISVKSVSRIDEIIDLEFTKL